MISDIAHPLGLRLEILVVHEIKSSFESPDYSGSAGFGVDEPVLWLRAAVSRRCSECRGPVPRETA